MPLPKLSPLQSRLAASLIASITLILLYFALSLPQFAYAADVDSIRPEDHNHERLLDRPFLELEELELREITYEAEFLGADRGIIGRATTVPTALINNRMDLTNIQQGQTVSYMFSNTSLWGNKSPATPGLPSQIILQGKRSVVKEEEALEDEDIEENSLRTRQTISENQRTLYVTVTTCSQPDPVSNVTTDPAPQLQLYISQSPNNTNPGPGQDSSLQEMMELDSGYALYTVNATGDVYIGVYGQNDTAYSGVYSAQVAASIDAPYHYYWNSSDPNVFLVDSDDNSALLYTDPFISNSSNATLWEEWMDATPPFVLFVNDVTSNSINGMQHSYCGLQKSQIGASIPGQTTNDVETGITSRGTNNLPRQQFYTNGLSPGRTYNAILAMNGNSTASGDGVVGGGGQVFTMTSFSTMSDGNCAVITDLSFCDQVAYSVPSNPNNFPNMSSLAAFYDNNTQASYIYFQNVLAQIPCETTASAQYSLARTCADCAEAYKAWLCAVSIPRCTDYTSPLSYLQPRALGQPFPNGTFLPLEERTFANQSMALNGSRNVNIDQYVVPGPYKEILPCDDLCYELVQSCPSSMGFNCPQPGYIGFNTSYGQKPLGGPDDNGRIINITCNRPGEVYFSMAVRGLVLPPLKVLLGILGLVLVLCL